VHPIPKYLFETLQGKWRRANELGAMDAWGRVTICSTGTSIMMQMQPNCIQLKVALLSTVVVQQATVYRDKIVVYGEGSDAKGLYNFLLPSIGNCEVAPMTDQLYGFVVENKVVAVLTLKEEALGVPTVRLYVSSAGAKLDILAPQVIGQLLGNLWKFLRNGGVVFLPEHRATLFNLHCFGSRVWGQFIQGDGLQPEWLIGECYYLWDVSSGQVM
jgi:hypothetical protein